MDTIGLSLEKYDLPPQILVQGMSFRGAGQLTCKGIEIRWKTTFQKKSKKFFRR